MTVSQDPANESKRALSISPDIPPDSHTPTPEKGSEVTLTPGIEPLHRQGSDAEDINQYGVRSRRILRWVGYGLLTLYLVDILYVLWPPDFTNVVWEYQTMGDLARLVPALLLSLVFIFYGETTERRQFERQILRLISWAALLFAALYFLMVPLTAINSIRINRENNAQISSQVSQQKQQLAATEAQLEQATPEQLESLVPTPDAAGNLPNAPTTPEEAKEQVLTRVGEAKRAAETQASEARANLKENLIKNSIKITAEAFVAGFALIYIWALTPWARQLESYGRRLSNEGTNANGLVQRLSHLPKPGSKRRRRNASVNR
jgi:hypothetical protein